MLLRWASPRMALYTAAWDSEILKCRGLCFTVCFIGVCVLSDCGTVRKRRLFVSATSFSMILFAIPLPVSVRFFLSGSCGFIFFYPEFEEDIAGDQKNKTGKRKKNQPDLLGASKNIEQGIILKQRDGNYAGKEFQDALAVDGNWIFSEFQSAVGENVHEFQTLDREKTDTCIQHEQRREHGDAPDMHKYERKNSCRRPMYAACGNGIDEHQYSLKKPADPGEFDMGSQNLKNFTFRTQQNTVKIPAFYQLRKYVEAPRKALCQGKGHEHDRIAQQHLAHCKAFDGIKAGEHEIQPQKCCE